MHVTLIVTGSNERGLNVVMVSYNKTGHLILRDGAISHN